MSKQQDYATLEGVPEEVDSPKRVSLRTGFAILASSVMVTFALAAMYYGLRAEIADNAELTKRAIKAIDDLKDMSFVEADRYTGAFYVLNKDKFPDLKIPRPSSVRDGDISVYGAPR